MSFTGKAFSKFVNGKVNPLGQIYTEAYNNLIRQMNDFAATPWSRDRATAMLAQVDAQIGKLDTYTQAWIKTHVPDTYLTLGAGAKKDIKKLGVIVPEKFGQIHADAIAATAQDATLAFGRTMIGIRKSAEAVATSAQKATTTELLKLGNQEGIRNAIGAGQITGESADVIAGKVQTLIENQGITALVDKSGRNWQLDTYAQMVARQVLANAGRDAVRNVATEYGLDLAQINDANSQHQVCADWEGEIVSINGDTPGYPTLDDATADGLFHVGCVHGYYIVSGQGTDIPADNKAVLDDGTEVPLPDAQTQDALQAMAYDGSSGPNKIITEDGKTIALHQGDLHRWVDDNELQSIIDTGKLAPTPENTALEAGGGYFGRPGHKDFAQSSEEGKIFLDTLQSTSSYTGTGMHHLILSVDDIPKGVSVLSDPRTTGSVSLKGSIPMQNLSIVQSMGSKIIPGANIDWKGVTFPK